LKLPDAAGDEGVGAARVTVDMIAFVCVQTNTRSIIDKPLCHSNKKEVK